MTQRGRHLLARGVACHTGLRCARLATAGAASCRAPAAMPLLPAARYLLMQSGPTACSVCRAAAGTVSSALTAVTASEAARLAPCCALLSARRTLALALTAGGRRTSGALTPPSTPPASPTAALLPGTALARRALRPASLALGQLSSRPAHTPRRAPWAGIAAAVAAATACLAAAALGPPAAAAASIAALCRRSLCRCRRLKLLHQRTQRRLLSLCCLRRLPHRLLTLDGRQGHHLCYLRGVPFALLRGGRRWRGAAA